MDALRAIQLLTAAAYLALGIAALANAVRARERARLHVAILFGALAVTVAVQEITIFTCATSFGCIEIPLSTQLAPVLLLLVPYALLRLVDDISDIPRWQ